MTPWGAPATAVIANGRHFNGPWQVADPRCGYQSRGGAYGVADWATPSHAVIAASRAYQGQAVADPRIEELVGPPLDIKDPRPLHLIIRAADGTWHRPLTTLELAVLQSFPAGGEGDWLVLDGKSHQGWRQRIGNAVPVLAAEAIARSCLATLAAARDGSLLLCAEPVLVQPG